MEIRDCRLTLKAENGKIGIETEDVSLVELATLVGFLQVFLGQQSIESGIDIEDVKDKMLELHLVSMEALER